MIEPRNTPDRADDEPIDSDIALMTDYLAGALSAAESEAVEDRMLTDEAFYAKVNPLITMWTLPGSYARAPSPAIPRETLRAIPRATPDARRHDTLPVVAPAKAPPRTHVSGHRVGWLVAAALALIVARPVYEVRAYAITVSDAAALAKLDTPGPDPDLWTFVSTRQREETTVEFPSGSRVTLRPQSRLTWRSLGTLPRGIVATLKGEATIEVSDAERTVFLGTIMGGVILRPGLYAVRCELGCTAMRVTVGPRGHAYLNGTGLLEWVSLGAGDHGEVRYPHWPTHTTGYQYPEIKP